MSSHTSASSWARAPDPPRRTHPVAGPAAWSLGTAATALTSGLVTQVLFAAAAGWSAYAASATTVLIGGQTALVAGVLWLLVLIPFVTLHRDGAVTRPAYWSAVVVGVAIGFVVFAPVP